MTQTDPSAVFAEETTPATTQNPTNESNPQPTQEEVFELVGEGKKYRTVAELEKAKTHADNHIKTLEDERVADRKRLQDLEVQLAKSQSAAEIAEALRNAKKDDGQDRPSFDLEQIDQFVTQKYQSFETQKVHDANLNSVATELTSKLGSEVAARKYVNEKAASLGMTVEALMGMASQSPNAALALLEVSKLESPQSNPPASSSAAGGTPPSKANVDESNWSYWQQLRRSDPKLYQKQALRRLELVESGQLTIPV